jgi:hypothetical protein
MPNVYSTSDLLSSEAACTRQVHHQLIELLNLGLFLLAISLVEVLNLKNKMKGRW